MYISCYFTYRQKEIYYVYEVEVKVKRFVSFIYTQFWYRTYACTYAICTNECMFVCLCIAILDIILCIVLRRTLHIFLVSVHVDVHCAYIRSLHCVYVQCTCTHHWYNIIMCIQSSILIQIIYI